MTFPTKETKILKELNAAGHDAYVVGGAVRDLILGSDPKDIDIATSATPDEIINLFEDQFDKVDLVGKSFGVIIIDGIEVATFRTDQYSNDGGPRDVNVKWSNSIEEDLARRDLTINAIALDQDGNFIDPFNGIKDIEDGIVRFVGIPENRIREDNCRILRAIRFASSLQFVIEPESGKAIVRNAHLVDSIAPERIRLELLKALEVKEASRFFSLLASLGVLETLIPELFEQIGHDHGKHHKENVWEHSLLVGDDISPKFPIVKLAGYLHDIGKPDSYKWDEEKGHYNFHAHHHIGARIVKSILLRLAFSTSEIEKVVGLVETHMTGYQSGNKFTPRSVRKALKRFDEENVNIEEFIRVRIADRKGNINHEPYTFSEIRDYVKTFNTTEIVPFSVNDLALSGGDLIKLFKLEPGPIVGRLQRVLLAAVIEEGEELNTLANLTIRARSEFWTLWLEGR